MNIGFYDPITERWIKPRPERESEPIPCMSMGEALLAAVEAKAREERNAKIWEYLRQSAEGCNAPTSEPSLPVYSQPTQAEIDETIAVKGKTFIAGDWFAPPIVVSAPPEYEAVESLGYVYWRKKETA